MQVEIIIERDGKSIEVLVDGRYYPFCRGARDGRFGPPIEPDEPAHVEIEFAQDENGNEMELTEREQEQAHEALMSLYEEYE